MVGSRDGKPLYTHLYFQVLTGITLGVLLGYFWPSTGAALSRSATGSSGSSG